MQFHKRIAFIFQAVTIGLALAFVVTVFRPELLGLSHQAVVEIKESPTNGSHATPMSGPVSYAAAVEKAAPAVVNVYTRKLVAERSPLFDDPFFRRFFGDQFAPRKRLETSLGSGVIVSERGYILTNNHVVEGADEIQVALHDGRNVEATVVGTDPEADLAVLKVDLASLPTIVFGQSQGLKVGDVVLAIGNPFGVGQTVTQGIVSATGRSELGINTFENFIQTDAAINPGNSGGALITAEGTLVGINTAIFSRSGGNQGIGFAIPVSLARQSMKQIIEHGHVSRGWLGIEVQELTPALAESFGVKSDQGVVVAGVLRNGPADQADLRPGDVLIAVGGTPVQSARQALNAIARAEPGAKVELEVIRNGKTLSREATAAERPAPQHR